MSYLDIGYNEFLEKELTPAIQRELDSIDIRELLQEDSIKPNALISGISADKLSGGTLTINPINDGKIIVTDEDDEEILRIDKNGLKIYKGKIELQDEDESTFIDNTGLIKSDIQVGEAIFDNYKNVGSSYFKMDDTLLSLDLAKKSKVYFFISTGFAPNSDSGFLTINIDGVRNPILNNRDHNFFVADTTLGDGSTAFMMVKELTEGKHYAYLEAKGASTDFVIQNTRFGYIAIPY